MTTLYETYYGEWIREAESQSIELLAQIKAEYFRARSKHRPLISSHEAYGVLMEEVEEWFDEIKANNLERARKEAIQIAAMALAFLMEVK